LKALRALGKIVRPRRSGQGGGRPLKLIVRQPITMRVFSSICAVVAAALSALAMFGVIYSGILNRTDRESLIAAFFLLCAAAPLALIAVALSLLNRLSWPKWLVRGSIGGFTLFATTAVLWTIVNT